MYLIARKTFLGRNLKKLYKIFPEDYSFFPKTWIIPNEFNELKTYVQNNYNSQNINNGKYMPVRAPKKNESIERVNK